jgi:mRNA-degrading endonuclease toxin of MazEF toxin-antitoxin module
MIYEYFIRLLDWCKVNVLLVEKRRDFHFNEGEIWWCSIGLNIGEEEFGKGSGFERPVLIFKKLTRNSFLGLPLTGHKKDGSWYVSCAVAGRPGSVMLNQARILDKARLSGRMATLNEADFYGIKLKFRELYCTLKFSTPVSSEEETWVGGKSRIVP